MARLAVLFSCILLSASPTFAKGLCTAERECPLTVAVADAQKAWTNCVLESTGIQARKTDDPNAAVEAAFAACATEEESLFALLQKESNLTRDEALNFKPVLKAHLKAKTLDILRNGPSAEKCRRALREGGMC